MKKKKVINRVDKLELAIEAMKKATCQFEEAASEVYTKDLGSLYLAYDPDNQGFYISSYDLQDGWDLSFEDFTIQLIENLYSAGDIDERSTSLASALREAADAIELFREKYLANS
jgi:hypothetical protein